MTKRENLGLFEGRKIRTKCDDGIEKWYFSTVDVVGVLANNNDCQIARKYWNMLKQCLCEEGSQPVTYNYQLKLRVEDVKLQSTDVTDPEQLFRIVRAFLLPGQSYLSMRLANSWKPRLAVKPFVRCI